MCVYNNIYNKIISIINNKMLKLTIETFIMQAIAIITGAL